MTMKRLPGYWEARAKRKERDLQLHADRLRWEIGIRQWEISKQNHAWKHLDRMWVRPMSDMPKTIYAGPPIQSGAGVWAPQELWGAEQKTAEYRRVGVCRWLRPDEGDAWWHSDCGLVEPNWMFEEHWPETGHPPYCYCGGRVEAVEVSDE